VELGGKWLQIASLIIISLAFFMLGLVRVEHLPLNIQVSLIFISGAILLSLGLYLTPFDKYTLFSRGLLFGGLKVLYSAFLSARFNLDFINSRELLVGWLVLFVIHVVTAYKVRSQLLASSAVVMAVVGIIIATDQAIIGTNTSIILMLALVGFHLMLSDFLRWGTLAGVTSITAGVWLMLHALEDGISVSIVEIFPLSGDALVTIAILLTVLGFIVLYRFQDEGTLLGRLFGDIPFTRAWDLILIGQLLSAASLFLRYGFTDPGALGLFGWTLVGVLTLYLILRGEDPRSLANPLGASIVLSSMAFVVPEEFSLAVPASAIGLSILVITISKKREHGILAATSLIIIGAGGYILFAGFSTFEPSPHFLAPLAAGVTILMVLVLCYKALSDLVIGGIQLGILIATGMAFQINMAEEVVVCALVLIVAYVFTWAALVRQSYHLVLVTALAPLGVSIFIATEMGPYMLVTLGALGALGVVIISKFGREMDIFSHLAQGRNEVTVMFRKWKIFAPQNLLCTLLGVLSIAGAYGQDDPFSQIMFPLGAGLIFALYILSDKKSGRLAFVLITAVVGIIIALITDYSPTLMFTFTGFIVLWLSLERHHYDGSIVLVYMVAIGIMGVGVKLHTPWEWEAVLWTIITVAGGVFIATLDRQRSPFFGGMIILLEVWLVATATWDWQYGPYLLEVGMVILTALFALVLFGRDTQGWTTGLPIFFAISAYLAAFITLSGGIPSGASGYQGWFVHGGILAIAMVYMIINDLKRSVPLEALLVLAPLPLIPFSPDEILVSWLVLLNGMGLSVILLLRNRDGLRPSYAILMIGVTLVAYGAIREFEITPHDRFTDGFVGLVALLSAGAWWGFHFPLKDGDKPPWMVLSLVHILFFFPLLWMEQWWSLVPLVLALTTYSFIKEDSLNTALGLALVLGLSYVVSEYYGRDGGQAVGILVVGYLILAALNEKAFRGEPLTFVTTGLTTACAIALPWVVGDALSLTITWVGFGGISLCLGFVLIKRYMRYIGILFLFLALIKVGYDYTVLGWETTVLTLLLLGGFTMLASYLYFKYSEAISATDEKEVGT